MKVMDVLSQLDLPRIVFKMFTYYRDWNVETVAAFVQDIMKGINKDFQSVKGAFENFELYDITVGSFELGKFIKSIMSEYYQNHPEDRNLGVRETEEFLTKFLNDIHAGRLKINWSQLYLGIRDNVSEALPYTPPPAFEISRTTLVLVLLFLTLGSILLGLGVLLFLRRRLEARDAKSTKASKGFPETEV